MWRLFLEVMAGCDSDELTPNVRQAAGYKCLQVILQFLLCECILHRMQPGINDRLLIAVTEPLYSRTRILCFRQLFHGFLCLASIFALVLSLHNPVSHLRIRQRPQNPEYLRLKNYGKTGLPWNMLQRCPFKQCLLFLIPWSVYSFPGSSYAWPGWYSWKKHLYPTAMEIIVLEVLKKRKTKLLFCTFQAVFSTRS